jgi:hypothetical protein
MTTDKVAKKRPVNDNIKLVKIAFPKKRVTVDVSEDLGMTDYPGVKFVMWDDPAIGILANVVLPLSKDDKELTDSDADAYFDALNELILDSNIEGLDFSTVTSTAESFDHKSLPWGFISQVAALYCAKVITESNSLKKMFGLSGRAESSGENNNETE